MTETATPTLVKASPALSSERPTTNFQFAGKEYTARAPKSTVWMLVSDLFNAIQTIADAQRQLDEADKGGMPLDPNMRAVLTQTISKYPSEEQCYKIMVVGWVDTGPTGRPEKQGGFLRRAVGEAAFSEIWDVVNGDNDHDEDWWSLVECAFSLYEAFHPWISWRQESIGLTIPAKAPARRTTTARKPGGGTRKK